MARLNNKPTPTPAPVDPFVSKYPEKRGKTMYKKPDSRACARSNSWRYYNLRHISRKQERFGNLYKQRILDLKPTNLIEITINGNGKPVVLTFECSRASLTSGMNPTFLFTINYNNKNIYSKKWDTKPSNAQFTERGALSDDLDNLPQLIEDLYEAYMHM